MPDTVMAPDMPGEVATGRPDRAPLVAFVADPASETALREGLADAAPFGLEVRRATIRQAIAALQKMPTPRVVIVDISGEDQPVSALVDLSDVVEPDVRVLVIGDREDTNFYRQITRGLGALEYLYKPLTRAMVARHFGGWVGGGRPAPEVVHGGRVISVTGCRGGAGATTIATNLAWHFAQDVRRHTLLLDPNLHTGDAALLLGAKSGNGLRTALESPQRIDELFIERTAQPAGDRLFVMASEEKLTDHPVLGDDAVRLLLAIVRKRYNFIIVDAALQSTPMHRDFLDCSHQRVIVAEPTLSGCARYAAAGLPAERPEPSAAPDPDPQSRGAAGHVDTPSGRGCHLRQDRRGHSVPASAHPQCGAGGSAGGGDQRAVSNRHPGTRT